MWSQLLPPLRARHRTSGLARRRICQSSLPTYLHCNPISSQPILLCHPIVQTKLGSTGILTCCPSATPFGLTLGPTYPGRTSLAQETLDFRRIRFSLIFSLLMPTFSLLVRPPNFPVWLQPTLERSPTAIHSKCMTHSFGSMFKPRYIFSAESLDQWAITLSLKDGCF